jgi:bacillithiol biosynthesis deacetylase BshB1
MELDILTIAAHPDDVEITCGGTVIKMVEVGYRVGLLDLTAGESGTRGNAVLREKEARRAAETLGVVYRENLHIPDAGVENTRENKLKIAQKIRELRPRTVILPYWEGRHPDHYTAGRLGYEACFLAGLAKLPLDGKPHASAHLRSGYHRAVREETQSHLLFRFAVLAAQGFAEPLSCPRRLGRANGRGSASFWIDDRGPLR